MSEILRKREEQQEEENEDNSRKEQEEALVALTEHRITEVEHLKQRISYYQSQVLSFSLFFYQYLTLHICFFAKNDISRFS